MHFQFIDSGSTAPEVEVFVFDNTGAGIALAHNAAGFTLSYKRNPTDATVPLTLVALGSETAAYTPNGWIHLGGGVHRLCLPAAAAATGADKVTVLGAALPANVFVQPVLAQLGFSQRLTDDELALAFGVTSQPSGGTTTTVPVRRNGVQIGVLRYYYDASARFVGRTALTPS
jgi:hypothetical protein